MFDPNTLNKKMSALEVTFVKGKVSVDHLYSATIHNSSAVEAEEWCESYFKNRWFQSSPFLNDTTTFYFAKEEDLLVFKLRYAGILTS
jgi:hypothetical protein